MANYRHTIPQITQLSILTSEFYGKVSYDFSTIVYLGLMQDTKDSGEIEPMVASRDGYLNHKYVYYKGGERVFNFYIRFRNDVCAEKAIMFFRSWDEKLIAESVNNVLLNWYILEMMPERPPNWTTAYVDIESTSDNNALSLRKVQHALRPFGYIRIDPKQTSSNSIKVRFNSFAEALGSTIAFGRWQRPQSTHSRHSQSTVYRTRIVGTTKEELLFRAVSGGSSISEVFELDYFISPQSVLGSGPESKYEAPLRDYTKARLIYHRNPRVPRNGACSPPKVSVPLSSKRVAFQSGSSAVSPSKTSLVPVKCNGQNEEQTKEIRVEATKTT